MPPEKYREVAVKLRAFMITEGLNHTTASFDWAVDVEGERTPVVVSIDLKGENLTISHRGRTVSGQVYNGPSSWLWGVARYDLEDEE